MTLNSLSLADLADTIARFGRGVLIDGMARRLKSRSRRDDYDEALKPLISLE
jgi:hypothetical protein